MSVGAMLTGRITPVAALAYSGGGGGASATWDPENKNANVTLSNGNLTATASTLATSDSAGRATLAITTGQKIYWEVDCIAKSGTAEPGVGFCNASFTFGDGNYLGIDANSVCQFQSTSVWQNNGAIAHFTGFFAGDTIRFALHKTGASSIDLWIAIGNSDWNVPGSGSDPGTATTPLAITLSGDVYPAYNVDYSAPNATQFTLRTTAAFTVPSGFTFYGS